MTDESVEKVIIVEGKSDKKKIEEVLKEQIKVICTNGTISLAKLDEFIDIFFDKEVYVLFDADDSGEKLRRQFKREFPNAIHLYINKLYKEVANAPLHHLASILLGADIDVDAKFLIRPNKNNS